MNTRRSSVSTLGALLLCAVAVISGLGGCAETQLAAHVVKSASAPPPAPGGSFKVGRPYRVNGKTYVPRVDPDFEEVGMASWYGAKFHGKPTANGDIFDMNALTAAHRTLPMPSQVRVTNLDNGRSMILTVNDRGPFVKDRVIDVSRRAAQLLGFRAAGTARVRVEVVPDDSRTAASSTPSSSPRVTTEPAIRVAFTTDTQPVNTMPAGNVMISPMAAPVGVQVANESGAIVAAALAPPIPIAPVANELASKLVPGWFVQGGAFREQANATRLSRRLSRFGPTQIKTVVVNGTTYYRVHVGPVYDQAYAYELLAQVVEAGHDGARLIIE